MISKKEILEKRIQNEFWIDPYGKIYKYDIALCDKKLYDSVSIHYEIAHTIMPDAEYPCDSLSRIGWCKYGRVGILHGVMNNIELTQSQINTLDRFYNKEKTK